MGIDGSNNLIILGPSKTLDLIENGGLILTDEEVNNDSDFICLNPAAGARHRQRSAFYSSTTMLQGQADRSRST